MGQRTIISSGVWVSPVEKRFRPTPLEAVRLRAGDAALIPLEAGRRLHAFDFVVRDGRPLSQLIFRVVRDHWLPGKRAGALVSVAAFFPLARAAHEAQHGGPAPPDRDLLAWATSVQGVERVDGEAKIVNAMYLDVDVVDAGEKVVFGWTRKLIDPNLFCRGPEEDHVCDSVPMDGVEVAAGWQMRFRPVFPGDGPSVEFIPVWSLVGHYLPEASRTACLRGRNRRARLPGRWNAGASREHGRVHRCRSR
jgi:hypothetical protein